MTMKIIIIGGGIGGLSTYLALKQRLSSATTIKLYEAYPSPSSTTSVIGGGLGLAPNGLRALHHLSPHIVDNITSRGFACATITFRNSKGQWLGEMLNGSKARYGFEQQLLPRAWVHEAVLAEIEDGEVGWGRRALRVVEDEGVVRVEFEGGETDTADLVLGVDGVRSIVRASIAENADAEYQGLTGTGGFLPVCSLPEKLQESLSNEPVAMTFGPNGFFGYSLCNADKSQLQWWSTWEASTPPARDIPVRDIRDAMLSRHGDWVSPHDTPENPVFRSIILAACGDDPDATASAAEQGVLVLPIYVIPRLQRWGSESGRILLMGDAAHAMPPDSGQGVACAVEDAIALAALLEGRGEGDLKKVREEYEALRMPRVHKILDFAKRMGDQKKKLSGWEEWFRDCAMRVVCRLPERLGDGRFAYDVAVEVEKVRLSGSRP